MGLKVCPGSIQFQCNSMNQSLQNDNESLQTVLSQISQFTSNTSLKGAAWSSMKNQLSNHEAVIQGIICANEAVMNDNNTLMGVAGTEELDEDKLNASIEQLQNSNECLQSSIDSYMKLMRNPVLFANSMWQIQQCIFRNQNSINSNNEQIQEFQEKLQMLYDIEASTSSLYSEAGSLYDAVNSGVNAIQCGWNGREFICVPLNAKWENIISKAWKSRENKLVSRYKRLLGIDASYKEILEFEQKQLELRLLIQKEPYNLIEIKRKLWEVWKTKIGNKIENKYAPILLNSLHISDILAFEYKDRKEWDKSATGDYYYTNENYGIQRWAGFMDLFDDLGCTLGMELETEIVIFHANGKEYRLQFWKGSYGFGGAYGGEIGLYERSGVEAQLFPYEEGSMGSKLIRFDCVSGNDEIGTEQYIYNGNKELLIENKTKDYADNKDHFWNLAIRTDGSYVADELTVKEVLIIEDDEIRDALITALKEEKNLFLDEEVTDGKYVVVQY
ncbi:MAG: DUF4474 domain-containing protein [Lachnospiraceae bacterium]